MDIPKQRTYTLVPTYWFVFSERFKILTIISLYRGEQKTGHTLISYLPVPLHDTFTLQKYHCYYVLFILLLVPIKIIPEEKKRQAGYVCYFYCRFSSYLTVHECLILKKTLLKIHVKWAMASKKINRHSSRQQVTIYPHIPWLNMSNVNLLLTMNPRVCYLPLATQIVVHLFLGVEQRYNIL